jgi:hypothetical protein
LPRRLAGPPSRSANEFDDWWNKKRAIQRQNAAAAARNETISAPPRLVEQIRLDVENVTVVLREFCGSDYARMACNTARVPPSEWGRIDAMFQSVVLTDTKLVVHLCREFDERNTVLLDRCAQYLRARLPQLREFHGLHRDGLDIY